MLLSLYFSYACKIDKYFSAYSLQEEKYLLLEVYKSSAIFYFF